MKAEGHWPEAVKRGRRRSARLHRSVPSAFAARNQAKRHPVRGDLKEASLGPLVPAAHKPRAACRARPHNVCCPLSKRFKR